ncbi:hypothetical protein [Deinococcus yavapaiensis]|nr:hypothetical protein [Deinococcus yavapaiensis]
MSYDYMLFKPLSDAPMETWPAQDPEPIGTLEDVRTLLEGPCPEREWASFRSSWFGSCPEDRHASVQVTPSDDGLVRWIKVSRVMPDELRALCGLLQVVALDGQKGILIRPETPS